FYKIISEMNRLTYLLSTLFLFPFTLGFSKTNTLRVEEVTLYLYAETVTGYEVVLPRNIKQVQQGIQKHLNEKNLEPFIFNEIMVCPDIYYPPITHEQKLSLYYNLEEGEKGKSTTLTFVGMYGYVHAINSQDDPDLALRMLLDMNELVSRYFGEQLDFNHIFEKTTHDEILASKENRNKRMEVTAKVDSNQYYLNKLLDKDTFKVEPVVAPPQKADKEITAELAERFQRYVAHNEDSTPTPFYKDAAQRDVQILTDSIRLLVEKMDNLQTENSNLQEEKEYLNTQRSYLLLGRQDFDRKNDSLQDIILKYRGENQRYKRNLDSLQATVRNQNYETRLTQTELQKKNAEKDAQKYRKDWETARYQADSLRRMVASMKGEKDILKKEVEITAQSKKRLAAQDSLRNAEREKQIKLLNDNVLAERNKTFSTISRMDSLRQLINQANYETQTCVNRSDSLERIASNASTRIANLMRENERLRHQIAKHSTSKDSVARVNSEMLQMTSDYRQRQQVYQQQINTLNDLLEEIKTREKQLIAGEMRLKQREKYLTQYEKRGEIEVLLNRIQALENEVSPETSEEISAATIKEVTMIHANDLKPAFLVILPPNSDIDKAEIVFKLRTKGLETTEQVPDLIYRNIYLEEITDRQLTMIVRVLDLNSEKNVIFAFELPDESYISRNNEAELAEKAKDFLANLFEK
ncbi:MAG: hypothetical protein ACKVTZ_01115, partial [Bacteroidia bacterium]